jgi:hypothetical protein
MRVAPSKSMVIKKNHTEEMEAAKFLTPKIRHPNKVVLYLVNVK